MEGLAEWAVTHRVDPIAFNALKQLLAVNPAPPTKGVTPRSEAAGQQECRLVAPKYGGVLMRNNLGACTDDRGQFIRYGLMNDSKRINARVKSSDLIGLLPMTIREQHVGAVIGVFAAIECKRANWKWAGSDREVGQRRFHRLVQSIGGLAGFARGKDDFRDIVLDFDEGKNRA